jgi:flagellar basal-body rod protein FlgF
VLRDGELFARDPNTPEREGVRVGRIMLRDASDRVMGRRQDGLFKPFGEGVRPNGDFQSGPQVASLTAGVLEGSNVSPIEAMVRMLDQTRSFETQVRIVKEARSLDESGSSMMRAR